MAAPYINLGIGQILITQSASTLGVSPINNYLKFGTVQLTYDSCDNLAISDSVMYDERNGLEMIYGSTIYILINEEHLSGKEEPLP
jgi:hypothetical protein